MIKRTVELDLVIAFGIMALAMIMAALIVKGSNHNLDFESISRTIECIETTEHASCEFAGIDL